jgi:hypothetical protein
MRWGTAIESGGNGRVVMPVTFHDREQAFEAKFAHDEEFRFLVLARRDKLFARWAAATLKLSGEAAEALVKTVLAVPDGRGHDQAVIEQVAGLLSAHGLGRGTDLPAVLERCMQDAHTQMIEHPAGVSDRI